MRAWRIIKKSRRAEALTGLGSRLYGGRWNSPGTAVVYASERLSLALLEMMVHLKSYELLRSGYMGLGLEFDDALAEDWTAALPAGWRQPDNPTLKSFGDRWCTQARSLALLVPSVVVPTEWNILLNPAHPDFPKASVVAESDFPVDERIIKTRSP